MPNTSSSALVVGIDQYWKGEACLQGAVNDALAMREWLLDPAGGGVEPENVKLLLGPTPDNKPENVEWLPATKAGILDAIADLVAQTDEQRERLYFYFAGHGITARMNFSDETTLLASDFKPRLSENSFTLRSLREYFETTRFHDQFFFIDACRDIPWPGEIVVGQWTQPRSRDPGLDPVQQFVLYATSPGLQAVEGVADERGAFTQILVAGLHGKELAKAWSSADSGYEVRWDRLVRFVTGQFELLELPAGANFQMPQATGLQGARGRDIDPVMTRFRGDQFAKETLKVVLEPLQCLPDAEIHVIDTDEYDALEAAGQKTDDGMIFELVPKTYGLIATAANFTAAKHKPPVELYASREITITLEPAPLPAAVTPSDDAVRTPGLRDLTLTDPEGALASLSGALQVSCGDRLATIEVADDAGRVLRAGRGIINLDNLHPGFYRARLRSPEGAIEETLVEVTGGQSEHVTLEAPKLQPSAVFQELIERAGVSALPDNTIEASELDGPIASAQLSTILTLAGSFAVSTPRGAAGSRLKRLGLTPVAETLGRGAGSGVYLLFGADSNSPKEAAARLAALRLRLWQHGTPIPTAAARLRPLERVQGVAEFVAPAAPGAYWLGVEPADEDPLVLPVALLPGRVTMIVSQRSMDAKLSVFQYMPSLHRDGSSEPEFLRRLELMQRVYASGRLDGGRQAAIDLLHGKWADPVAGCLGGYMLLSLGESEKLGVASQNMINYFAGLSDSHVLRTEYEASRGDNHAARQSALNALEVGLPIFADGLSRLLDHAAHYQINHPNARLAARVYDRLVKDSLWSAWTPPELPAGKLLIP